MIDKYIELLKTQIEELKNPQFDLKTWKTTTILVLERIYGSGSEKISQIRNLQYDYSSWTLRDNTGISPLEQCKKTGAKILETCINELRLLGLPQESTNYQIARVITNALEAELRIAQYRELKEVFQSFSDVNKRREMIEEKLKGYDESTVRSLLARILSELAN